MNLKPRSDDRLICDLTDGAIGCVAVAVAHDVGVFRALSAGPRAASELCAALGLGWRPVETLLRLCVAAGLVRSNDETYALTPVAEDYLTESSPTYAGWLFELWSGDDPPFTFHRLRDAVTRKDEWERGRRPWIEAHRADAARAASFTHMMHGHSMAPALAWPEKIDLSASRRMLDVGGGSGAHAIGALMQWPELEGILLDMPAVCTVARQYIETYQMTHRIMTVEADMWLDPWPDADVHFFSDVFHNWTPEECRTLARRSYEELPERGRILVHEMLLDDEKRGPFTVAASSMAMLAWCGGQQFSGEELMMLLQDAGFAEVEVVKTFGYWSVVMGVKP